MTEKIYHPEFVKGLFNRMSKSYERMNFITSFGFSIRWRKQFLQSIAPTTDRVELIDLLTGMGETWQAAKQKFPNARLTAIDFSEGMLKYAKEKSERHYNNEVQLIQQDLLQNNLPSNYYDIVICAFGLKTFDEEQLTKLAAETKRILKPGGQFTFIEVSTPHNKILVSIYSMYLKKMVPGIGKLMLGNPREYRMLWQYTSQFATARKATEIFNQVGLKAQYQSYFYNCASGFFGQKQDSAAS